MQNQNIKAHLALLGANLLYAGNFSIAKLVMPEKVGPYAFIILRVVPASILFFLLHAIFVKEKIERDDFPRIVACSVFGIAINQLLFFKGLSLANPINAALIMISVPIIVLIFSVFLLNEKMTVKKAIGMLVGLCGAAYVIVMGANQDVSKFSGGEIFIFLNASCYSFYLVIVKPLMLKYHPLTLLKWIFTLGLIIVIPMGFKQFAQIQWSSFNAIHYWSVVYVVIGVTMMTYFFNIYALNILNASTVGSYIFLQPILASIIAILMGQDKLMANHIVSALLIFSGVFLVSHKRKRIEG